MAPTPSKSIQTPASHLRTPQAKHRLHFKSPHPSPNPVRENPPGEHPVEVVGRIRDYPERKEKPISVLQMNPDRQSFRVRADIGYRDFSLDGVSLSEEEDLDAFYKKFIQTRINGVKLGAKCTIMMYGPTGSGKSHTMFGCSKQPGIVYRSLKDILGERDEVDGECISPTMFVHVTVLEIYNEEIYDLLSTNGAGVGGGGFSLGWPKGGSASKVRLEVMGKKAKNASFISGTEAGKISKEIQKVEKRRIVKSTLCNERSSRSHCMIILDVPTVGGRLMLVDMAGSENIEQAGQIGFEAKMQTAKINQGNIALKRVVESIANGDSHVPFRDSKLTMLLQDSFEDDKSKILMILCASPDPKEIHKTISTLEYGAKAKCIVRGPHTPIKDKTGTEDSSVLLGSRIAAMDQFIYKLQTEKKLREKECNEARKELSKKEQEVAALRAKLEFVEVKGSGASEEEINLKVNEQTQILKLELEKKLEECQRMATEFVELERRRMEEKIQQQQQEVEMLRRRLEEMESELSRSKDGNGNQNCSRDMEGSNFAKRLLGVYADEDMVKSMDLDMGDQEFAHDVKQATVSAHKSLLGSNELADDDVVAAKYGDRVCLSTVFEEEEPEEEDEQKGDDMEDEVVKKEIVQEKRMVGGINFSANLSSNISGQEYDLSEREALLESLKNEPENGKECASSRRVRIQNIFTLCGNHRELSQHVEAAPKTKSENIDPHTPTKSFNKVSEVPFDEILMTPASKENYDPSDDSNSESQIEVYVKWEASKENPGKFITSLKVVREATLADLRKLIEIYLGADNQAFTFLILGDPSASPVPKEKEGTLHATKLPVCNNQAKGYLACLRAAGKGMEQCASQTPLSPLENKMPLTPIPSLMHKSGLSPQMAQHLNSTPFITQRRR